MQFFGYEMAFIDVLQSARIDCDNLSHPVYVALDVTIRKFQLLDKNIFCFARVEDKF